jgi:exopolysaccharide production protein ExoZ
MFSKNPFPLGAFGVDIFFVISGFIICHAAANEVSPLRFAIKGLCRILPLYYMLTFGVFAIALAAPGLLNSTTADVEHLLKSLLFILYAKDNGAVQPLLFLGWTLNFEMFFYAVFTIAMLAGRFRNGVIIGSITLLVAAGYILKPGTTIAAFYTSGIMLDFVWGCLAYFIWKKWPGAVTRSRPFWPVAVALLLIQNFMPFGVPREFAYGLPAMFLLLSVLTISPGPGRVSDFFVKLGDASYPLYLIHPYILRLQSRSCCQSSASAWRPSVRSPRSRFTARSPPR